MINPPTVSVVINCYNGEKYLREAVNSVYAQTYQYWEIIFWDNASTDLTSMIAQSYDDHLKYYYSARNTSLYKARNMALEKCTGEYIAFLDCDDIWESSKLEEQMALISDKVGVLYTKYDIIDDKGLIISSGRRVTANNNFTNALFKYNPISISSVLIKRSLLEEEIFDPFYNLLGDYDLWVRLSMRTTITGIDKTLQYSRKHANNSSDRLGNLWLQERRYFYQKIIKLINIIKYPWLLYYIFRIEFKGLYGGR